MEELQELEESGSVKSYNEWIKVVVYSEGGQISIKNAYLHWGRFFPPNDQGSTIEPSTINTYVIDSGDFKWVCATGRQGAASGTQGSFDLYDSQNKRIGQYAWNCPWSGTNSFSFSKDASYGASVTVKLTPEKAPSGGAIGLVNLNVMFDISKIKP